MKKILNEIAIISAVILSGCTKENVPEVNPDGEMVLVHLNLGGEIDVVESPLTRAFTTDDLIGVQVYQGSDYYAYGLFDDVSKMNIYLHTGKKYKYVCTVVKNGKTQVYKYTSTAAYPSLPLGDNTTTTSCQLRTNEFSLPFIRFRKSYSPCGTLLENSFVYSSTDHYLCLEYGTLATGFSSYDKYPSVDRYYGEVSDYTAISDGSLSIPLKRVSFRISLSVQGITDGNVTVSIKNSGKTFHTNSGITQDTQFGTTTWSFFDLKSAWQYADNYTENFTVGVVWNRGVGVTQDLGTKTVQFKRNSVNHVKINLSSSTRSAGLAIALEDPEIANEDYLFGN